MIRNFFIFLILAILTSCSYNYGHKTADNRQPGGYYKIGQPYEIDGKTYIPKEEPDYEETGAASWYGDDFHNKRTANGDIFDKRSLTAAHRTLPLPSMVRVTNIENGRTIILMVNDRGPFSKGRILDVSERAAEILGFKHKGLAKVHVKFLPGQTKRLLAQLDGVSKDNENSLPKEKEETAISSLPSSLQKPESFLNRLKKIVKPVPEQTVSSDKPSLAEIAKNDKLEKNAPIPLTIEPSKNIDTEVETAKMVKKEEPVDVAIIKPTGDEEIPLNENKNLSGAHYIQVGAYGVESNANRVENELSVLGNVITEEIGNSAKPIYKVKLGPIFDPGIANTMLTKIISMGHPDALIVSEN